MTARGEYGTIKRLKYQKCKHYNYLGAQSPKKYINLFLTVFQKSGPPMDPKLTLGPKIPYNDEGELKFNLMHIMWSNYHVLAQKDDFDMVTSKLVLLE